MPVKQVNKMKKCLIVVNTYKAESQSLGTIIKVYLEQRNIMCDIFLFSGASPEYPFHGYDFAVTLGGDGTVLFAARGCAPLGIPVFPINLGEFGFIAGVQKICWQAALDSFLEGRHNLSPRSMVKVVVSRNGQQCFETPALNDVVVVAKAAARLVTLQVSFNGISFGKFQADGIIVATATGSTAYSAAAGGPIVDPSLDALILSPVCPFSLSNRPLVLPADGVLEAVVQPSRDAGVVMTADGQVSMDLNTGDVIRFSLAKEKVLLAGCSAESFYSALRSKLHWSGGPRA